MTVSPGWYDDGVTPGVERWFDGRGWTETTRATVPGPPAPPSAASAPAGVPVGAVWVPQEMPTAPGPAPSYAIPVLEPDPVPAPDAAAAGYPTHGAPYRPPSAGPVAAAASPYTGTASPYTGAAASPYTGAASPYTGTASPYTPATPAASPYTDATAHPVSRFGSDMGFGGGGPVSRPDDPSSRPPAPGAGFPLRAASPDLIESAFRAQAAERATDHRQSAVVMGILGVVLLVVAGGVLRATASTGTGTVWTWGFVAGGVLLVKAATSYVKSVRGGVGHFGPLGWTVSGGALLLAGVMVVTSVQAAFAPMDVEVGSCFTDEGPEVQQVDCARPHDYTTVAVVDSLVQCPASTDVPARLDDEIVCLVGTGLGFGD